MTDIWDKRKRSDVMSKIRSKNTRPEKLLRSLLFKEGFRFRIHDRKLFKKNTKLLFLFMDVFGIITKVVMKDVFQIQTHFFGKKNFPKI